MRPRTPADLRRFQPDGARGIAGVGEQRIFRVSEVTGWTVQVDVAQSEDGPYSWNKISRLSALGAGEREALIQ